MVNFIIGMSLGLEGESEIDAYLGVRVGGGGWGRGIYPKAPHLFILNLVLPQKGSVCVISRGLALGHCLLLCAASYYARQVQ